MDKAYEGSQTLESVLAQGMILVVPPKKCEHTLGFFYLRNILSARSIPSIDLP